MNKKVLIALGISLAVNFVFIGFEASCKYRRPAFSNIPPARPELMSQKMTRKSASPEMMMVHSSFREAFKNHADEMKEAKQAVEKALKKEPFDAKEFKAALKKASAVRSAIDAAVQENMVEMLSKMTPEERKLFTEKFEKRAEAMKQKGPEGAKRIKPPHKAHVPEYQKGSHPQMKHGHDAKAEKAAAVKKAPQKAQAPKASEKKTSDKKVKAKTAAKSDKKEVVNKKEKADKKEAVNKKEKADKKEAVNKKEKTDKKNAAEKKQNTSQKKSSETVQPAPVAAK